MTKISATGFPVLLATFMLLSPLARADDSAAGTTAQTFANAPHQRILSELRRKHRGLSDAQLEKRYEKAFWDRTKSCSHMNDLKDMRDQIASVKFSQQDTMGDSISAIPRNSFANELQVMVTFKDNSKLIFNIVQPGERLIDDLYFFEANCPEDNNHCEERYWAPVQLTGRLLGIFGNECATLAGNITVGRESMPKLNIYIDTSKLQFDPRDYGFKYEDQVSDALLKRLDNDSKIEHLLPDPNARPGAQNHDWDPYPSTQRAE